jgi:hypothetical protein
VTQVSASDHSASTQTRATIRVTTAKRERHRSPVLCRCGVQTSRASEAS